ncbi:MAG: septal ring lytic transglycosylase RlpA family protein [Gammaproteobacteria bacterium]|nr:septal ring lytic transglycosylase RlpA family lipoprotein [Gammaproteobacteria bacterium]MBQ08639.1 septal ring lytic transglycosylase RlpA family lipoprotein [Gammaproteobacteria bacterium]MDP6147049.1 septal ring lytic transglycosylase RlpA family protein [Gammaproteobacteria bacterium]HJL79597.1 septal ring lytic transglycosylase RlpA family protein [Gammaproteobacteria bacterium]HJN00445.1 septal ring lytic transglycosylase RlpA family protein [Gammaproteobacteria bacterium]
MNKSLLLLFSLTLTMSGCSLLQEDKNFNLTEQEVTSILNDACTIKRDKRQRYKIDGKRYRTLSSSQGYKKRGIASWYGSDFDGKQTACGEEYDMYDFTAAHKTLPLPSYVKVQNLRNGKTVIVKVNDRGPFVDDRLIDLSYAAAKKIEMLDSGTSPVRIYAVSEAEAANFFKKNDKSIFSISLFEKIVNRNKRSITLQVGAFSSLDGASSLKKKIESLGVKNVFISAARSKRKTFHRVRVGPVKTTKEYEEAIRKLGSLSLDINLISN